MGAGQRSRVVWRGYAWKAARRSASARSSRRVAASSRSKRLELDPAVAVLPGSGHRTVDEERRRRLRVAHVKDLRAMLLGQDPRPAGVDEQRRVPGRQEADRRRLLGIGQRAACDVEQLVAVLGPEAAQAHAVEDRGQLTRRQARVGDDVATRRRAEAGEVAPDELSRGVDRAELRRRADPVLGGGEEVGAAALPRSRGRDADEVDPLADAEGVRLADERVELVAPDRLAGLGEMITHARGELEHLRLIRAAAHAAQPQRAPRRAGAERERPEVGLGDEVDRDAHERRLDDRAPLERPRQLVALKPATYPRPQADVHRRRVLRLDRADRMENLADRAVLPERLEQALACEHRAVELALGEHPHV